MSTITVNKNIWLLRKYELDADVNIRGMSLN